MSDCHANGEKFGPGGQCWCFDACCNAPNFCVCDSCNREACICAHPPEKLAKCPACHHYDPHTGGGIGVCLHTKCGCDGPEDGPAFRTPPEHYAGKGGMQPWDVIDAFGLGYYGGNVFKYLARCGKKHGETREDDLKKIRNYIDKMIADGVD